jgi:hypothetical protein
MAYLAALIEYQFCIHWIPPKHIISSSVCCWVLRLMSGQSTVCRRKASVWASHGDLSPSPWGTAGSLLSNMISYNLCEAMFLARSRALANSFLHLWSTDLLGPSLPSPLLCYLFSETGPCTLLPSACFLLVHPGSQARKSRDPMTTGHNLPFLLYSWPNITGIPTKWHVLPSHLITHWFPDKLIFIPEDGGDMFLWNIDSDTDYMVLYPWRWQHS